MLKKLLALSAVAASFAFSANAETKVLWSTDVPEGFQVEWGNPALSLDAEQAATIKAGDILTMTVVGVTEGGWPQVAIFEGNVGWPPMSSVGVGGKTYPYVASFPVTNDMADAFHANGVVFKGDGAFVSEVGQIEGPGYLDPNTVWFGHEQLGWGVAISVPASVFADVKPGDKIQVKYDTDAPEHTLQILLGGWSGLNLATYEAWGLDFMTVDEETGTITIELVEELANFVKEDKEYNAFALLKENGLVMQGPCVVNAVLYIQQTTGIEAISSENEMPSYYNMQGIQVTNPENGQLYIVKKGNQATKTIIR